MRNNNGLLISPLSVVWLVVGFPVLYVLSWCSIRVCGLCCGCGGWFGGWWVVAVGQSLLVTFGLGFSFGIFTCYGFYDSLFGL